MLLPRSSDGAGADVAVDVPAAVELPDVVAVGAFASVDAAGLAPKEKPEEALFVVEDVVVEGAAVPKRPPEFDLVSVEVSFAAPKPKPLLAGLASDFAASSAGLAPRLKPLVAGLAVS